jgi:hypothetical protein
MAGHSRSKNGVASLAYVPAIHVLLGQEERRECPAQEPVLGPAKRPAPRAGHDGEMLVRKREMPYTFAIKPGEPAGGSAMKRARATTQHARIRRARL